MQTRDNNVVRLSFAVQYQVKDPFEARFRLEDPDAVVRDAAQAAMREVVGRTSVDGVLREKKALVTAEVERLLQQILDAYESGLEVQSVQLQDVQPPEEVRAAFADVVVATQDASRLVNEAEGHRNEVVPGGSAENPLKARWLGIVNGVGIHGTDATWSLGSAASHGCIRMSVPDVKRLYPQVPVGALVMIK